MERPPFVRRTELVTPAHSLRMMAKAASSEADEVIFDLEDAVAPGMKEEARRLLIEALRTLDFRGKVVAYRMNGVKTKYAYRDVIEVIEAAGEVVDCLIIPKSEGPEDVLFVDRLLTQIEAARGLHKQVRLEVLIETASALLQAEQIARCSPRLSSLIFGPLDYAASIGAREVVKDHFSFFHYPRAHLLAAAKAAGLDAIDGITLNVRDRETLIFDARMAAAMGFDGKWVIHPDQIGPVNEIFSPSVEEIARARRIIEAYRKACEGERIGAIVVDDQLVDEAVIKLEERKLLIAKRAGLL